MNLAGRIGPVRAEGMKSALLGGAFWFAWAFSCYQGVYMQKNGFSPSEMGLINALCAAAGILSVSFWGMISDKVGSIKKIVFIVILLGSGTFALIPLIPTKLSYSYILFLIFLPAVNFFRGSMTPMQDNMQVRTCNELRLNFGVIRAFGSLCFTIGSLIVSKMLADFLDVSSTFWLTFVLYIPTLVLVYFARDPVHGVRKAKKEAGKKAEKLDLRPLLKNKRYICFLVFSFLFYIAATTEGSFIPYYMEEIGINSDRYGVFLAYRALLEVPLLILVARLRTKIKLEYLVMLGVTLMSIEGLLFATVARSMGSMILSTTFFGLGNGLFIGSSLNYLYQLAPANLKATAQSFFSATASIAGIVGNLIGGLVFSTVGATNFYFVVFGLYLLSVGVFLISSKFLKNKDTSEPAEA